MTVTLALIWQSQPKQRLNTPQVRRLIEHDDDLHSVHLFLRTSEGHDEGAPRAYTYLGTLKYLSNDADREEPVYFQWQLLAWPPPDKVLHHMGLSLVAEGETPNTPALYVSKDVVLTEQPAPTPGPYRAGVPTAAFRSKKTPDYAKRDAANRGLGLAGELAVFRHEVRRLEEHGRSDLAKRVRHLPSSVGDGAGYDIESFDVESGEPTFIEVKTTRGAAETEFYMSANELEVAHARGKHYALYRVFQFDEKRSS